MDLGLRGHTALVTGASRGIGRGIALGLAREGCNLAVCARDPQVLRAAAAEFEAAGAEVLALAADVTSAEGVERTVRASLDRFGAIQVLVNNVGGSRGGATPTDEDWQGALDLNLFSTIRTTRLLLPQMRERSYGRIINVASIYGRESGGNPTYNAAKAAVISYSKSLARQLAPEGITVNSLCPGSILFPEGTWDRRQQADPEGIADFIRRDMPMGRFGRLEEVVPVAVFLASPLASLVTGTAINVDGGQSRSLI